MRLTCFQAGPDRKGITHRIEIDEDLEMNCDPIETQMTEMFLEELEIEGENRKKKIKDEEDVDSLKELRYETGTRFYLKFLFL